MKIGILLNTSWNAYNFRSGLIKSFLAHGYEVVIIAPVDSYVEPILDWGCTHRNITIDQSGLNPIKDLVFMNQVRKIAKEESLRALLTYTIKPNIYGTIVGGQLGIPTICNVSGLGTTFLWKNWVQTLVTQLYRFAFKKAYFIFFQNGDDHSLFLKRVKIRPSKTDVLPGSGIDVKKFKAKPPAFQRPLKFLMISRLLIEKGVAEYVEAAKRVLALGADAKFTLVGLYDPDHRRSIEENLFNELRKSDIVEYLGESNNVKGLILDSDVVVLPSYREGTPRTLLEGASMSRPLIATNVPGCKDVVAHGVNGLLCESENEESLTNSFIEMLALTKEQLEEMSQESRHLIEHRFDEQLIVKAYMGKILEIVGE